MRLGVEVAGSNELWVNNGSGAFVLSNKAPAGGNAPAYAAAFADVDGDGDLDLFLGTCKILECLCC